MPPPLSCNRARAAPGGRTRDLVLSEPELALMVERRYRQKETRTTRDAIRTHVPSLPRSPQTRTQKEREGRHNSAFPPLGPPSCVCRTCPWRSEAQSDHRALSSAERQDPSPGRPAWAARSCLYWTLGLPSVTRTVEIHATDLK